MTISKSQLHINQGGASNPAVIKARINAINAKLVAQGGVSAKIKGAMFTIDSNSPWDVSRVMNKEVSAPVYASDQTWKGGKLHTYYYESDLAAVRRADWLMPLNFGVDSTHTAAQQAAAKVRFSAIATDTWLAAWGAAPNTGTKGPLQCYKDFALASKTGVVAQAFTHYVRLGWEFNGKWYGWGDANNNTEWVAAYRAVVTAMRSVNPNLKFIWCPSAGPIDLDPVTGRAELMASWPGKDYVDVVGLDIYHRPEGGSGPFLITESSFNLKYKPKLDTVLGIAKDNGKPICFPEWALGSKDIQGLEWLRQMALWMKALPETGGGSLLYHQWFSPTSGKPKDGSGQAKISGYTDIITPEAGAVGYRLTQTQTWYAKFFGGLTDPATTPAFANSDPSPTSPPPPTSTLAVSTTALVNGTAQEEYSSKVDATGGTGIGRVWTLKSGALPPGLSLSSGGNITGTPTTQGIYTPTFQVAEGAVTASKTIPITVNGSIVISTASVPNGEVGAAYSSTITATGGSSSYTWSVVSGSLPPGLTLSTTASATTTLSGTPTSAGTFSFTVKAQDVQPASGNGDGPAVEQLSRKAFVLEVVSPSDIILEPAGLADTNLILEKAVF